MNWLPPVSWCEDLCQVEYYPNKARLPFPRHYQILTPASNPSRVLSPHPHINLVVILSVSILQMKKVSFKKRMNVSKITQLTTEGARTPSQVFSTQHSTSASHTRPAGGSEQSRSWGGSFSRVFSRCIAQFCVFAVTSAWQARGVVVTALSLQTFQLQKLCQGSSKLQQNHNDASDQIRAETQIEIRIGGHDFNASLFLTDFRAAHPGSIGSIFMTHYTYKHLQEDRQKACAGTATAIPSPNRPTGT